MGQPSPPPALTCRCECFFYRISLTAAALDDALAPPKVQDCSVGCWSRPLRKETANNAQEGAKWGGRSLDDREAVAERSAVPRAQDLPQESACREPGRQAGASRSQGSAGGTPWSNLTQRERGNRRGRRPSSRDGRGRDPNHRGGMGREGERRFIHFDQSRRVSCNGHRQSELRGFEIATMGFTEKKEQIW